MKPTENQYNAFMKMLEGAWIVAFGDDKNFKNAIGAAGASKVAGVIAETLWIKGLHFTQSEDTDKLRYQLEQLYKNGSWDYTKFEE